LEIKQFVVSIFWKCDLFVKLKLCGIFCVIFMAVVYGTYHMQRVSAALCYLSDFRTYAKSMEKAKIRAPVKSEPLKFSP